MKTKILDNIKRVHYLLLSHLYSIASSYLEHLILFIKRSSPTIDNSV